MPRKKRIEE